MPPEAEGGPKGKPARHFADRATAALAGRCVSVRFDTPADGLAPALATGDATFAALPIAAVADLVPSLEVIDLPFLFDSPHHALASTCPRPL